MEQDIEFLYEMFPVQRDVIYEAYITSNKNIDEAISTLVKICSTVPQHPPSYEEAIIATAGASFATAIESKIQPKESFRDSMQSFFKKQWKPPILGKLSDDFLKVPIDVLSNSSQSGSTCKGCARGSLRKSVDYSCASVLGKATSSFDPSSISNIDTLIRRRMADNVSDTRNTTMNPDNDKFQYLDDERLSLMLQNQEFRDIIKADPEFKRALEEDRQGFEFEKRTNILTEVEESNYYRLQDNELDYGYERMDIVDPDVPWPDQPSRMVESLGRASKRRLKSIASRFSSSRKNKSPRKYSEFDSLVDINQAKFWAKEMHRNLSYLEVEAEESLEHGDRPMKHHHPMSVITERSI